MVDINWIDNEKISYDIKQKMDEFGFEIIGLCPILQIVAAKKSQDIICPEIIDSLCSNIDICPYNAREANHNQIIFLNNTDIKKLFQQIGLIAEKIPAKISPKDKKDKDNVKKFDRATKKTFDKLKFELTKKIAAENPNLNALKRALLEEFGISAIPPELIAVFNMEIKQVQARKLGMKFTDYILYESGKLKIG